MITGKIEKKKTDNGIRHFVGGGLGGFMGAIVTCPLEVVKTRMQSSLFKQPVTFDFYSLYFSKKSKFLPINEIMNHKIIN